MEQFTNLFSFSKTLRFGLRPVGKNFIYNENNRDILSNFVSRDFNRDRDSHKIKMVLNDYHREFIEDVLSSPIFSKEDIDNLYEIFLEIKEIKTKIQNKDKEKVKEIEELKDKQSCILKKYYEAQTILRKKISKKFKDKALRYFLNDDNFSVLINESGSKGNKQKGELWKWLKQKLDNNEITQEYFDEITKCIEGFNQFSIYFTKFNQNKNNMYVADKKGTAIPNRIVNENAEKHFSNCYKFSVIKETYPDLYDSLIHYEFIFSPDYLLNTNSQEGIDKYNRYIGLGVEEGSCGINQVINKYRQANQIDRKKLPNIQILYKQILGNTEDRGGSFTVINSDSEVFETIENLHSSFFQGGIIDNLNEVMHNYLIEENLNEIFLNNDNSLVKMSLAIFSEWDFIENAIFEYIEENYKGTKAQKKKICSQKIFSIEFIQQAINFYCDFINQPDKKRSVIQYFKDIIEGENSIKNMLITSYKDLDDIKKGNIHKDKRQPSKNNSVGGPGFYQIEKIKKYMDAAIQFSRILKPLNVDGENIENYSFNKNEDFYILFDRVFSFLNDIYIDYNKIRNYVTKKPYSRKKIKINFDNASLLKGWSSSLESIRRSIILQKNNKYYLGVIHDSSEDLLKSTNQCNNFLIDKEDNYYKKMTYNYVASPSKMLPKIFFAKNNIDYYSPSKEIIEIREKGSFKNEANNPNDLKKWIDFMKESLLKHPEWSKIFNFKFKPSEEYKNITSFYKDVQNQGYKMSFEYIKDSYIEGLIENDKMILFEIYSKDMSLDSSGKPNLHTMFWRSIFDEENLKDVVIKLDGDGEMFFRKSSISKEERIIHKKNEKINNKNPLNKNKTSIFDYDIIKDKRYTEDKFFLHCPITLNYKSDKNFPLNDFVNEYLTNNSDIYIIGIDRGERNLLYYTVINLRGQIIEQGSLNSIENSSCNGKHITNYHSLLDSREKERNASRKSWSSIKNIKEIKEGYLSYVVHKIQTLMLKYNAIICLENLNSGFKRRRSKVEKQIYHKFEKALINKLNYVVIKNNKAKEPGGILKAYQFTNLLKKNEDIGDQTGFIFYVNSSYTSKIDPTTGFVNCLETKYINIPKTKKLIEKFDCIKYNKSEDYFEFHFDYNKISKKGKGKWIVCSHKNDRYRYNPTKKETICYNVNDNLKNLFKDNGINFEKEDNLIKNILRISEKNFFSTLLFNLSLLLQLRNTFKNKEGEEVDYILSPVINKYGEFFDSRKEKKELMPIFPENSDANGSYHIAKKGIMVINQIKEKGKPSLIRNNEWFDFVINNTL